MDHMIVFVTQSFLNKCYYIGEVILSDKHDPESDKVLIMSHITKELLNIINSGKRDNL